MEHRYIYVTSTSFFCHRSRRHKSKSPVRVLNCFFFYTLKDYFRLKLNFLFRFNTFDRRILVFEKDKKGQDRKVEIVLSPLNLQSSIFSLVFRYHLRSISLICHRCLRQSAVLKMILCLSMMAIVDV